MNKILQKLALAGALLTSPLAQESDAHHGFYGHTHRIPPRGLFRPQVAIGSYPVYGPARGPYYGYYSGQFQNPTFTRSFNKDADYYFGRDAFHRRPEPVPRFGILSGDVPSFSRQQSQPNITIINIYESQD